MSVTIGQTIEKIGGKPFSTTESAPTLKRDAS